MEARKATGSCDKEFEMIRRKKEYRKRLSELNKFCLGIGCLKPVFDVFGREVGCFCPSIEDAYLPCVPNPHCLMEIYRKCSGDPDSKKIFKHLMDQIERESVKKVKPDYFSKCFVREFTKPYRRMTKPILRCPEKPKPDPGPSFEEILDDIIKDVPLDEPWNRECYLFNELRAIIPQQLTSNPFPEKTHVNSPWPWVFPLSGGEGYSTPCKTLTLEDALRR